MSVSTYRHVFIGSYQYVYEVAKMRWVAMSIMWLAVAVSTIGTAYFLRPDRYGVAAFVVVAMTVGATLVSVTIVREDPATFEDEPRKDVSK